MIGTSGGCWLSKSQIAVTLKSKAGVKLITRKEKKKKKKEEGGGKPERREVLDPSPQNCESKQPHSPDSPTWYCNGNSARLLAGSLLQVPAASMLPRGCCSSRGKRTLQPHCPQGHITEGVLGSEEPPEQVPVHERGRGVHPGGSTACSGSPHDTKKQSCAQLCWSTSGLVPGPSPLSCWATTSSATLSGAAQPSLVNSPGHEHPKWAQS